MAAQRCPPRLRLVRHRGMAGAPTLTVISEGRANGPVSGWTLKIEGPAAWASCSGTFGAAAKAGIEKSTLDRVFAVLDLPEQEAKTIVDVLSLAKEAHAAANDDDGRRKAWAISLRKKYKLLSGVETPVSGVDDNPDGKCSMKEGDVHVKFTTTVGGNSSTHHQGAHRARHGDRPVRGQLVAAGEAGAPAGAAASLAATPTPGTASGIPSSTPFCCAFAERAVGLLRDAGARATAGSPAGGSPRG